MKGRRIFFWIMIAIAAAGVCFIIVYFAGQNSRGRVYEDLKETAAAETPAPVKEPSSAPTPAPTKEPAAEPTKEPAKEPAKKPTKTPTPTPTPEPYVSPINFDELWEINPDVIGWIQIDDTPVAYPILQSKYINDYYVDHTIEDYEGLPGSICLTADEPEDFSAFNTVIYGHNMNDGSMFGSLKNYSSPEFLQDHRKIKICTPEREDTYTVFAAVVYGDDYLTGRFPNSDIDQAYSFLDSLNETRNLSNIIMDDVAVTKDDRIITLSTCTNVSDDTRFLVVAVRDDADE